jgi:bifunctional non-homologous end joining protein LigD
MAWRLFTRNGVGWSGRFGALMPDRRQGDRLCGDGLASFDLIRHHRANHVVFLYAFDLIELNGNDMRRDSLEGRKATLEMILASPGLAFGSMSTVEGDGEIVFRHACKLGLEGIVSKRKDSAYSPGRSPDWLKMKNSAAPAVKREAEEE